MTKNTRLETIQLGELCRYDNGGTPSKSEFSYWDGEIPWITSSEISDGTVRQARNWISNEGIKNSATKQVPAGTLLLVTRTGVGKVAICTYSLAFSQDITAIYPDESRLDRRYLRRFLEVQGTYFDRFSRGATIKGITRDVLNRLEIPLPPLPEQKRIADILDKADAIRRKRQEMLKCVKELAAANFFATFGDPLAQFQLWNVVTISDVADIIVPTRDKPKSFTGEFPWVTLPDIQDLFVSTAGLSLTSQEAAEVGTRLTPKDAVLLSCAGSLCVVAITTRELYTNQQFYALLPNQDVVDPVYLAYSLLLRGQEFYKRLSGTVTISFFSKAKAMSIPVALPPLAKQKRFANEVCANLQLQRKMAENLSVVDNLFNSLVQRAFQGEL